MGSPGQIDIVQANIRVAPSVHAAVQNADAVINCVGILYPRGAQKFDAVQARGAEVVAFCAREAGVARMVNVSDIGAAADSKSAYARRSEEHTSELQSTMRISYDGFC